MSMSEQSLSVLQAKIRQFCDERNWDQFHNGKDLAISLSLEAAELLEHFQWKDDTEVHRHMQDNKSEVAEELADVFYWVLLIANKFDIDLVEVFDKKMIKNAKKYPVEKARDSHKKYTELS